MPELVLPKGSGDWYAATIAPLWEPAHRAIVETAANHHQTMRLLRSASRRHVILDVYPLDGTVGATALGPVLQEASHCCCWEVPWDS